METTLVLLSGIPGTGKSAIAEALARRLAIPVFALDWLLGSLMPIKPFRPGADLGDAGRRLLLSLIARQLMFGQSVIVDCPAHDASWRDPFLTLAAEHETHVRIIETTCSSDEIHRERVQGRQRGIPGWHEFNWSHVERMRLRWQPWPEGTEHLVLDSVSPLEDNVARAVAFVTETELGLFRKVDSLQLAVSDIDAALVFYGRLGHRVVWRTETAAGLAMASGDTEIVVQAERPMQETDLTVTSVPTAVADVVAAGGRVVVEPFDIAIGLAAVVADPWGNQLVVLDNSKGSLVTDEHGNVTGVS